MSETSRPTDLPSSSQWTQLTLLPTKRDEFTRDIYFRECWSDCLEIFGPDASDKLHSIALLSFKPDAIVGRRVTPTMEFLEREEFVPLAVATIEYTRHSMRELWRYNWQVYTVDRLELVTHMHTSNPSLLVLLRDSRPVPGVPGSVRLSSLKGSADPDQRRPGQLRTVLEPPNRIINFVHVADEPADIVRELGIFLERGERRRLLRDVRDAASSSRMPVEAQLRRSQATLEQAHPSHDFELQGVLARVEHRSEFDELLATGQELTWTELRDRLAGGSAKLDRWDLTVLACNTLALDRPGGEDLLPAVAVADWQVRAAAPEPDVNWRHLTAMAGKREAYSREAYFRESYRDFELVFGPQLDAAAQRLALMVFKPEAYVGRRTAPALEYVQSAGFRPIYMRPTQFTRHIQHELWRYQWNSATLAKIALSTIAFAALPTRLIVLYDTSDGASPASVRLKALKGSASPHLRKPGTLRATLDAPNRMVTFVHTTDEPVDVIRELGVFLDQPERLEVLRSCVANIDADVALDCVEELASMEAEVPSIDFDPDAAWRRLLDGLPADHGLHPLHARYRNDGHFDWEAFMSLATTADADVWDLITIGTATISYDEPGYSKAIDFDDATLECWQREPDRMVTSFDPRLLTAPSLA